MNANKSRSIGQDEKNRTRNRFVDIIPFDDNYVKLGKYIIILILYHSMITTGCHTKHDSW